MNNLNLLDQLKQGISYIYQNVIKPQTGETILILSCDDNNTFTVGKTFYDIGKQYTSHISMIFHPEKNPLELAEKAVMKAFTSEPDIFIITNMYKDGVDYIGQKTGYTYQNKTLDWYPLYLLACKKSRGFFFSVNSLSQFSKAINCDYNKIKELSIKLKYEMNKAVIVHITDKNGTDLHIDISNKNRTAKADYDGTQDQPGKGINIPFGEVLISPVMGTTVGKAYIDVEFYDEENTCTVVVDKPIEINFSNGLIQTIKGGNAAKRFQEIIHNAEKKLQTKLLEKNLTETEFNIQMRNIRSVSEFAIGVHKNAGDNNNNPIGDLLFDEKIYGTCHIAFGMSYDGDIAPLHSDFIFSTPEIYFEYPDRSTKLICKDKILFL